MTTRYNASKVQLNASCSLGKIGSKINVEEVELKVGIWDGQSDLVVVVVDGLWLVVLWWWTLGVVDRLLMYVISVTQYKLLD